MRKKSTRLLSAALAACMMLSVLPVGAFALEVGAADPAAAVSEQKAATPYHLDGDKDKIIINEGFIAKHGNTYTIGGEETYQYPITIDTNQDVTIKFINNVNCNIMGYDFDEPGLLSNQRSFINAKKVGKLIISNEGNYKFNDNYGGGRFLGVTAPDAIVEVNGGSYGAYAAGTFYFKGCNATLTDVTVDNYEYHCVLNDHATVTIDRGRYTTPRMGIAIENWNDGTLILKGVTAVGAGKAVLNEGGKVTIDGGRYTNSAADGNGGKYSAVRNEYRPDYGHDATMTILDGEFETKGKNAAAIVSSTRDGHGWLEIKGGTFTASRDGGRGIQAQNGVSRIENATIKGCQYGICCGTQGGGTPQVTIKDVQFEDNTNDVYQDRGEYDSELHGFDYPLVEIEEGRNEVITAGTDGTFVGRDDVIGGDIKGRQFTTATDSHYQKDLKLVSTDPKYIIDYQKKDDGTEYRYFNTRETGKYYVNPIHATMAFEGDEKQPYSQFEKGDKVTLTAFSNEGNKQFTGWKVEEIAADGVTEVQDLHDVLVPDSENPETATLIVPDYDVFVTAVYEDEIGDLGTGDDAAGNIQGAISAVVVGAAAGAIIYEAGTGIYRVINMPGIPMPSNRIELAELLWEHAGKPEPVSTALYSDIDEDDPDAQKAARWAVEQDLMKDDADNNKFNPYFPVSKLRTCLTWNAAKEKGLFDTDKPAE